MPYAKGIHALFWSGSGVDRLPSPRHVLRQLRDRRDGYVGEARVDLAGKFARPRYLLDRNLVALWHHVRLGGEFSASFADTNHDIFDPRLAAKEFGDVVGHRVVFL